MLYSLCPAGILISVCQPLTTLSYVSHPPFFSSPPWLLYLCARPIHLTPGPSAPFLFDISLIPPCLSTLVISSIFQHYSHTSLGLLPFLFIHPFVSPFSPQHINVCHILPLRLFLGGICNLLHFQTVSISHRPSNNFSPFKCMTITVSKLSSIRARFHYGNS